MSERSYHGATSRSLQNQGDKVPRRPVLADLASADSLPGSGDISDDDLNGAVANKLHSVKPVLGDWQSSYRRCRKDEVVLCRARIGHTHLTHSYILRKDLPPQCEYCQCILTVRHILVECNHFAREMKDIFGRRDVVESFRFHPTLIVLFLKQTKFYDKF